MNRLALSHSRLQDFNQCPLKFQLKYIEKAKNMLIDDNNKSIHLIRGQNVHKALENYLIKRKTGQKPEELKSSNLNEVNATVPLIENYINFFGIDNMHPEKQICVGDKWEEKTWFAKDAFYRGIFDVIGISSDVAFIGDYKTGKFTDYTPPNGYGQLELSAAIALSIFDVETVNTSYLYVDHKQVTSKKYTQQDRIRLVEHFTEESAKVNAEKDFDPKKNQFCRWCDATADQCQFGTK